MRWRRGRRAPVAFAHSSGGSLLSRQGNKRAYGPDANDPVRLVGQIAAVLSIGAGVLHISAAGDHTDIPLMFAGFILVAALQIGLGALLIWRPPSRFLIVAAIAMTLSSIGLWVLSRTSGLQFIGGEGVEPVGFKDGVTKLFEIATIPVLLLLLSRELPHVSVPPHLGNRALTVLGTACLALLPLGLLGAHSHPAHHQAMAMGSHDAHETSAEGHTHPDPEAAHSHSGQHDAESAQHAHDAAGDGTAGAHQHSDSVLASAPLGTTHHHGGTQTPAHSPRHHSGSHDGGHHERKHGGHSHDRHHGGHRGDHGHGDHGGGAEGEPAISVSYEPEPRVCVTAICFP